MKKVILVVILLHLLTPVSRADNAPVTAAGVSTGASGSVTVPVCVSNFIDIGSFKLTMTYSTTVISYVSTAANSAFSGVNVSVDALSGTLVFSWTGSAGITLPDYTHLLDITFTYNTGTSALSWDIYTPNACYYKKYAGGTFQTLTDTPKESFYINGGISNRKAPVTCAPVICNAVPGTVQVPFTVTGFSNIGALSLELEYDPDVLSYQGFVVNPAFISSFTVSDLAGSNGKRVIQVGWYSLSPLTLADGSALVTLNYTYINTTKSFSLLTWIDSGPSCQYSDGSGYALVDLPNDSFYKNGLVFSGNSFAPQAILPVISDATPAGSVSLPIVTNDFNSVKSFALSFTYDPSVMTYSSFIPNPTLGGTMTVTNNPPSGGLRKLVVAWNGALQTLPPSSTLVTLSVSYISGATALSFVTDASSCFFADNNNLAYFDTPKNAHYQDGLVTSHAAPHTIGWYAVPSPGQPVTIPVKVTGFTGIGYVSLTLDYDPGVMTWQSAALVPSLGGTFTSSLTEAGRMTLYWSGTAATLADSAVLFNLTFNYIIGTTPLAWYDNGSSCKYAEGSGQPALYDLPQSRYFVNGFVGLNTLAADFLADNTLPPVNGTSPLNDLSPGSPVNWNWSISPGSAWFASGTYTGSQYPVIYFPVNGEYSITLKVSKGILWSTKTRNAYIHVGTPGLWTGFTSADWSTASNWHNWLVPDNTVNVTIPASVTNWPLVAGDLATGVQAKNITLDNNAQLTVNGNFSLTPGFTLGMGSASKLDISGNWSNTGIFIPGTGSVEFYGSGTSSILNAASPITSLSNYVLSPFSAGMTPVSGSTVVSLGDNNHSDIPVGFSFNYLGTNYTTVRINSNGWLSMNQSGDDGSSSDNPRLFTSGIPNTTLAPWWDDLLPDGTTVISYVTTGTSPNRIFTAEWKNILSYSTGASAHINFQVKLYETTNVIEFCYGSVGSGSHYPLESASVGIEDGTGGSGHFIEGTTGSMTTGVTNLNSYSNWPLVNSRFIPPPAKETFYNISESKNGAELNIQKDIIVNGDLIVK